MENPTPSCPTCKTELQSLGQLPVRVGGTEKGWHFFLAEFGELGERVKPLDLYRCARSAADSSSTTMTSVSQKSEVAIMTSLFARIFRPRARSGHLTFTVYTRVQCCCCHKALDLLKDFQRSHGFRIDEVDIDADPELVAKYGNEVPVVAVNGKVRFRGVVNPVLLERLLAAQSQENAVSPARVEAS